MSENLLPCPFCGEAMMYRKALHISDGNTDSIIHAVSSGCGMSVFDNETIDESVISLWNTRVPAPARPAHSDFIRALLQYGGQPYSMMAINAAGDAAFTSPSDREVKPSTAMITGAASINQDLLQTCKKAAEWLSGWSSAVPYLGDLLDAIKTAERVDPAFQEALHDMRTHQDAWRNAIQHMLHASTGDEEYWRHELKAFNRTAYALAQELPPSDAMTADAWQNISTAPKDGVSICAWNGEFTVMHWVEGDGYALWVYSDELLRDADPDAVQPTHWMPQPDGPAQLRMTVEGSDHD